ncbi:3-hydroxyacyl-CoA dehydrogenase family protein [Candidatus Bathyarchaeota archaeon]|nr:MAG: 3-hydroxyacyl-CoA dehydrogenase family protein [Candidatus Bathyarchaeota archaeon]RLI16205.1 MAG: 3-hydroxybutyryl-CoA dehydrogenase [Candidatus Bathyarchaeota archaeon]HDN05987.1 3-hydroxyacyl-CoA dehydrogenase family protein [Candidatus Bathyarchaeota archaeon]
MVEVKRIAVLGAGLMGHGICQVAAQSGYEVNLRDIEQRFLDNGMQMIKKSLQKFQSKGQLTETQVNETLGRIHPTLDLKEAVSNVDLVVEAVPENVELKKATFKEVDMYAMPHTIIASNTSSISITELGSATNRPEKVCGMHFFNPPQLMKLVEVVRGAKTSDETIQTVLDVAHKMGKETVLVKKDSPGFIVNRILIPALNEAVALYWEGVADRDDIDKAVKLGLNWPMGPLLLIDYIGADTTLAISEVLTNELDPKFHPCTGLKQMVKARLLGRKTGKGFYDWTKK